MRRTSTFAVAGLLALSAGLGLAACGSDDETTESTTTAVEDRTAKGEAGGSAAGESSAEGDVMKHEGGGVETIVVRNGEPVGGVAELSYSAGEAVRFKVRSDVADEVHVHGYDLSKDVAAGGTVSFSFPAELEGIFEVELEQRVEQIAELRVNP